MVAECWNVKRPSITSRHERLFSKNRWQIIYLYICTDNIVSGIFFVPICLMTWQYHCYNTLFNTMLDQKCKTNKLTIHYNTLLNTMLGPNKYNKQTDHPLHPSMVSAPSSLLWDPSKQLFWLVLYCGSRRCRNSATDSFMYFSQHLVSCQLLYLGKIKHGHDLCRLLPQVQSGRVAFDVQLVP